MDIGDKTDVHPGQPDRSTDFQADDVTHDNPEGSLVDKHLGFLPHQQDAGGKKNQRQKDEYTPPHLSPADLITPLHI